MSPWSATFAPFKASIYQDVDQGLDQGLPVAVIRLDVTLVEETQHRLLAERRFEAREPSTGTDVQQVVEAFGRAADALTREIAEWSEGVLERR